MAKEKNSKNDKTNNRSFKKDFKAELKKVVWPTSKQMVNNVTAVITIVIITALIVFALDFAFGAMNKYGIKLKQDVANKNKPTIGTAVDNNKTENGADADKDKNKDTSKDENKDAEAQKNDAEAAKKTESAN